MKKAPCVQCFKSFRWTINVSMQNPCFLLNYITKENRQIMQTEKVGYYSYFKIFTTILQTRRSQVPHSFALEFFYIWTYLCWDRCPLPNPQFFMVTSHIACTQDKRLYPNLSQIGESRFFSHRG